MNRIVIRLLLAGMLTSGMMQSALAQNAEPPQPVKTTETKDAKSLVMLDFEIIDETLDEASVPAQKERLKLISKELRDLFIKNNLYAVVDKEPAADLIAKLKSSYNLHDCNGCDVEIGKALNADRVMTAWVQKVSNLILNINIQIRDVDTGLIMLNKSVDIRGNDDRSWLRGVRYMVRSMVEKGQANR
jgi:hypothetical protein